MHRVTGMSRFVWLLALVFPLACGDGGGDGSGDDGGTDAVGESGDATPDEAERPDEAAADPGADAEPEESGGGTIQIFVAGDATPRTFSDGLAGQTPFDYFIGVSSYEVLRSADDSSPVPCLDYGADTFAIDIQTDNLVGQCSTSAIPSGTYTHGKTKVDWVTYKVSGLAYAGGMSVPGTFEIFRAFSACDYEGRHYAAGDGWVGYDVMGTTGEFPYEFGVLPALPGVTFVTEGDSFWIVFPFTHPFTIASADPRTHWARMFWEIFESYRWLDLTVSGYVPGTWDVSTTGDFETPLLFGVSGYHIESSGD